ncbi:MAG: helix-turn-helix transcriptional regulator [Syntrophobacteraceae bacterium]
MKHVDYRVPLVHKIAASGWSIEELSGLTRIPETSIYRILRGEENLGGEALQRLAVLLNCAAHELIPPGGETAANGRAEVC